MFTGRIGRIDLHPTNSGEVLSISIAVNESYKDRSDQWQEKTNWVRVTKWKPSEYLKNLQPGDQIFIEGRFREEKYKDKEGKEVSKLGIIANSIKVLKRKSGELVGIAKAEAEAEAKMQLEPDQEGEDLPF